MLALAQPAPLPLTLFVVPDPEVPSARMGDLLRSDTFREGLASRGVPRITVGAGSAPRWRRWAQGVGSSLPLVALVDTEGRCLRRFTADRIAEATILREIDEARRVPPPPSR